MLICLYRRGLAAKIRPDGYQGGNPA